ncbi:MAG: hypothetical protein Q4A28_05325 [Brachymonas sp.]|nr:hypothetical protein [Brachymonas sp.]
MNDWSSFASSSPAALPAALQGQLAAGEQLLWQGRPRQGLMLRRSDAWHIPFSLAWCGFAIFWEWSVIRTNAPLFFKLWGIPFVLVGLYMVAGRFVWDARNRSHTHYALTTERLLIASGKGHAHIQSLSLRNLPDISLSERADGTGTISLGCLQAPFDSTAAWGKRGEWPGRRAGALQLVGIANARQVFQLIRDAQRRQPAAPFA